MKFTDEEEKIIEMLVEEAEESLKVDGTISEEEFLIWLNELEVAVRREIQLTRKNIKLNLANSLKMTLKRFIRV